MDKNEHTNNHTDEPMTKEERQDVLDLTLRHMQGVGSQIFRNYRDLFSVNIKTVEEISLKEYWEPKFKKIIDKFTKDIDEVTQYYEFKDSVTDEEVKSVEDFSDEMLEAITSGEFVRDKNGKKITNQDDKAIIALMANYKNIADKVRLKGSDEDIEKLKKYDVKIRSIKDKYCDVFTDEDGSECLRAKKPMTHEDHMFIVDFELEMGAVFRHLYFYRTNRDK